VTESELADYVGKSIKNALETRTPGDGDTQVTRRRKKSKGRGQPQCELQLHQEQQPIGSSQPNKRKIPPEAQKSHEPQPQQEHQPPPKKRGRPPGKTNNSESKAYKLTVFNIFCECECDSSKSKFLANAKSNFGAVFALVYGFFRIFWKINGFSYANQL
jgi:hypothetical protein